MHMLHAYNKVACGITLASMLVVPIATRASQPAESEEYVLVKSAQREAQEALRNCLTRMSQQRESLDRHLQAPLANLFARISEEKPTLAEKIQHAVQILASLQDHVSILRQRTLPLLYQTLDAAYTVNLEKVSLTPHQVYPHIGLSNKNTAQIPLETIQQTLAHKEMEVKQKLLELNVKQATQEKLVQPEHKPGKKAAKKQQKWQRRSEDVAFEIKKLEREQTQLQQIDPIFRNALAKQAFDAYLQGEDATERLQLAPEYTQTLTALAQEISACKTELEKKKTELEKQEREI